MRPQNDDMENSRQHFLTRQTRNTQDLSHHALKLIVELHKCILKQNQRTGAQKMVDLVVRETASEQSKLYLSVVYFPQQFVHRVQRISLILHKVCGESLRANGSSEQLHAGIVDSINISWERIRTPSARPPNLVLLHIQIQAKRRTISLDQWRR